MRGPAMTSCGSTRAGRLYPRHSDHDRAAATRRHARGGGGADTLLGGNDSDDRRQRGAPTGQLGAGDDTFVWDPGDGSDVVEGQANVDTLRFDGANIAELVGRRPTEIGSGSPATSATS